MTVYNNYKGRKFKNEYIEYTLHAASACFVKVIIIVV